MTRQIERATVLLASALALCVSPGEAQLPRPLVPPPTVRVPNAITRKVIARATTVTGPSVQSLTLNPDALYAGQSSSITVELASAAPEGGVVVLLGASPQGAAQLPESVTVPAGATTASFVVATTAGGGDATLTVSAGVPGPGGTLSATLRVVAAVAATPVATLTVATPLVGGSVKQGTVTLAAAAQGSGAVVTLTTSNQSLLTVPASVVVPTGQKSQTFPLTPASFSGSGNVTVTATSGGVSKTANIVLQPGSQIVGFAGFPAYLKAGTPVTGTVTIAGIAPAGGLSIPVWSKTSGNIAVPATVTIPAGQSTGQLVVTGGGANAMAFLYRTESERQASPDCYAQYAQCVHMQSVDPPFISSMVLQICGQNSTACRVAAATVEAGQSVVLDFATGNPWPDPVVVSFASSAPQVVPPPAPITFSPGNFYTTRSVSAGAVTTATAVTITATCAPCSGSGKSVVLTVTPGATVSGVSAASTDVKGGTSTTGTVTLSKAAGPGGAKVDLTSSNPTICTVPPFVTVPAGQTTAVFTITTQAVLSGATINLGASTNGGASKTTTVRVVP